MRIILRIVGLIGVLIFGASFYFTYGVPGGVEEIAKDFVKERVEEETKEKIDSITLAASESTLGKIALTLIKGRENEIEELKLKLQEKTYEKSAAVIAEMRDLNCECRIKYAQNLKNNMELRISGLEAMNEKLMGFMKSKYMEVVNKRKRSTNPTLPKNQPTAIICIFTFQGNSASTSTTLVTLGSSLKT